MQRKISIVIPVYGRWDLLKKNIDSNLTFEDILIEKIIVIDDCSPDTNPYTFPDKVFIVRNEKNLGYTGTVNRGLHLADTDIVVLLDSDAYSVEPFLGKVIQLFEEDVKLGCIGFKTVDEHGRDTGNTLAEPSVLSFIAGQQIHSLLRKYNFLESKNILPFSCAVSFRKDCLETVGYLDENFKVLEADHDLSMRIYRSKWKLVYRQDIQVFHKGGSSISKNSKRVISFYESRWQLLKKHNKLRFPGLIKRLVEMRIGMEIGIFWLLRLGKKGDKWEMSNMKYQGRKQLLVSINKLV